MGALRFGADEPPDVLRQVDLPIVSDSECARAYGQDFFDSVNVFCAGGERGRDNCSGDSGGPLVVGGGAGGYLQAGVVNFSTCRGDTPGGYAPVATLRDFILDPAPIFAPFTVGRPRLSGDLEVGRTLRCNPGTVRGQALRRRFGWLRLQGGEVKGVGGADGARYVLRRRDADRRIACSFVVSNAGGSHGTISRFAAIRAARRQAAHHRPPFTDLR